MSFDLCFWRQDQPITAAQAQQIYLYLLGDSESEFDIRPDDRVARFHTEMMELYPALEGLDDPAGEASPWSMTPEGYLECVIVTMKYSKAEAAADVLIGLADEHGLVCFDPQAGRVHNPADILATDGPQLSFRDGGFVNDPAAADLRSLLLSLSERNWYAILERGSDGFVQVGMGQHAGGLADGQYAMEYRPPAADQMLRLVTDDFDQVATLFESFTQGSGDLVAAFDWEPGFVLG